MDESDVSEPISGRAAFSDKLAELISGAQMELALMSLHLSRRIYTQANVLEALKTFALRSERSRLRVLVADARAATADGNSFLDMARKLPSRIQLRELTPERRETEGPERLIVDTHGLLELPAQDRLDALYYAKAPLRVREQIKEFDARWEESEPVLELRGFNL